MRQLIDRNASHARACTYDVRHVLARRRIRGRGDGIDVHRRGFDSHDDARAISRAWRFVRRCVAVNHFKAQSSRALNDARFRARGRDRRCDVFVLDILHGVRYELGRAVVARASKSRTIWSSSVSSPYCSAARSDADASFSLMAKSRRSPSRVNTVTFL
jgi:hypothetical protein